MELAYTGAMYMFKCAECGNDGSSTQPHAKMCSERCRLTYWGKRSRRLAERFRGISTATTGAVSELVVSAHLLQRGFAVFRALSASCFCDLIAIKDNVIHKIEVRTGYKSISGIMSFPKKTNGDITCFAVYERNEGSVTFYTPGGKEFSLSAPDPETGA